MPDRGKCASKSSRILFLLLRSVGGICWCIEGPIAFALHFRQFSVLSFNFFCFFSDLVGCHFNLTQKWINFQPSKTKEEVEIGMAQHRRGTTCEELVFPSSHILSSRSPPPLSLLLLSLPLFLPRSRSLSVPSIEYVPILVYISIAYRKCKKVKWQIACTQ